MRGASDAALRFKCSRSGPGRFWAGAVPGMWPGAALFCNVAPFPSPGSGSSLQEVSRVVVIEGVVAGRHDAIQRNARQHIGDKVGGRIALAAGQARQCSRRGMGSFDARECSVSARKSGRAVCPPARHHSQPTTFGLARFLSAGHSTQWTDWC